MADYISKWTSTEIDNHLGKGLKSGTLTHTTLSAQLSLQAVDGSVITITIPNASSSSVAGTSKSGLIKGTELATLNSLAALESYVSQLISIAESGGTGGETTPAEAYKFAGVVSGVAVSTSSIGSLLPGVGAVFYDSAKDAFVLLYGGSYYLGWTGGDNYVNSSIAWASRLTPGATFYTDRGDGTMRWFYYDGTQMLEAAPTIEGNTLVF